MPAIQWSDVVELVAATDAGLAAKFTAFAAGLQAAILGRVENLAPEFFDGDAGPVYALARRLLAAHIGFPIAAGGISGPVISRSEGGVSESYALPFAQLTGLHSSTAYGRAFDELLKSMPNRVGVTT